MKKININDMVRIKLNAKELQSGNWIDDMDKYLGEVGKVTEVGKDGVNVLFGNEHFGFSYFYGFDVIEPFIETIIQPQYPIIEHIEDLKVVFNPPYTIVMRSDICYRKNYEGKAKCYHLDTYDKWEGFKVALSKMKEVEGEFKRR